MVTEGMLSDNVCQQIRDQMWSSCINSISSFDKPGVCTYIKYTYICGILDIILKAYVTEFSKTILNSLCITAVLILKY